MKAVELRDQLIGALEVLKGQNIVSIDVADLTTITDFMVIVSGRSNRHVKALVDEVIEAARECGEQPLGVEGRETNEWVLLDVGDVVVHIMQKDARAFYDLERFWSNIPLESQETETTV